MHLRNTSTERFDVLVAGAGPAGLATAIACRQAGFARVCVFDARTPAGSPSLGASNSQVRSASLSDHDARPSLDKACGEGLLPHALAHLLALTGDRLPAPAWPLGGIRYHDRAVSLGARFAPHQGLGVARTVLHRFLLDEALAQGVEIHWGIRLIDLVRHGDGHIGFQTSAGTLNARWLVGADGLHAKSRRLSGLQAATGRRRRYGFRVHLAASPQSDEVEVHWGQGAEAYLTPLSENLVGLAVLAHAPGSSWDQEVMPDRARLEQTQDRSDASVRWAERVLTHFPSLHRSLGFGDPSSLARGKVLASGSLEQHARGVHRANLALVGDAAGYMDAITGEGIGAAFLHARSFAFAARQGDLRAYESLVKTHRRAPHLTQRLLRGLSRHDTVRSLIFPAMAQVPPLFARLVNAAVQPRSMSFSTAKPRSEASTQLQPRRAT